VAQADSVPSSSRQLTTGESASQSTNLPAVRVKPSDRSYFIGGLGARGIMGNDEAAPLLRHCREKHDETQPEGLLNRRWYEANTGQGPMGSNIGALFYATAVFFVGWLARNILLIWLLFLSRNKRLRFSALDKMSSNRLVRSRPQGRLK
jgi:hypothetical protein